jgi:hypothetical protein
MTMIVSYVTIKAKDTLWQASLESMFGKLLLSGYALTNKVNNPWVTN